MRNRGDLIGGLLFLLAGVGILLESFRLRVGTLMSPQPGFFPFVSGAFLVVFSLVLMVHTWLKPDKEVLPSGKVRGPAIVIAAMAVYVGVLDPLGYILSTIFVSVVILRVLGIRSWRVLGGVGAALSIGTYLLFARFLGIELPPGVLEFLG